MLVAKPKQGSDHKVGVQAPGPRQDLRERTAEGHPSEAPPAAIAPKTPNGFTRSADPANVTVSST